MRRRKFFFAVSIGAALLWLAVSAAFALPWANSITDQLPDVYVILVITGIALLPGYLMCAMFVSNLLNNRPIYVHRPYNEAVTVLICAKNEGRGIYGTIESIVKQSYEGNIDILCINNGSNDNTAEEIRRAMVCLRTGGRTIRYDNCRKAGKAHALNKGLASVNTKYFITVDADTVLERTAVQRIMWKIADSGAACVAGNLMVRDPRGWVQKMQIYDYLISIAAVKRFQGTYGSTLVAQGAFSAYETEAVRNAGGWTQVAGEDIVLTYRLMESGRESLYEPLAVGYTEVPDTLSSLCRQRIRWARGMFDGLRAVAPWKQSSFYGGYFEALNVSIVFLDLAFVFGFMAGAVMLIFGFAWFVGWITLLSLLSLVLCASVVYAFQRRLGVRIENSLLGWFCFMFVFQGIQSVCSLIGYFRALTSRQLRWK